MRFHGWAGAAASGSAAAIMMSGSLTFALGIYLRNFRHVLPGRGAGGDRLRHLPASALRRGRGRRYAAKARAHFAGAGRRRACGDRRAGDGQAHARRDRGVSFLATYLYLPFLPIVTAILLMLRSGPAGSEKGGDADPVPRHHRPAEFVTAVVSSLVGLRNDELGHGLDPVADDALRLRCGGQCRRHPGAFDRDVSPGFVTGRLIQKFGVHRIILIGGLLTLACVFINVYEPPLFGTFMIALALLGVGWNFMFVGGTTMLTSAHDARGAGARAGDARLHRVRQRGDDGGDLRRDAGDRGVGGMNLTVVPPVLIAFVVVGWHWIARARESAPVSAAAR